MIVDAGPLYAYIDRDDRRHAACLDLLETHPGPLIVPTLVIVEPVAASDWLRIAELVAQYRDLPLGTVDASVIAAAERLRAYDIATLDRQHFSVVRSTIGALNLLP